MEALLSSGRIIHGSLASLGGIRENPLQIKCRRDRIAVGRFNIRPMISAVHRIHGPKLIEGVSEELNKIAQENMDYAPARRQVREAFVQVQQNLDHCLFKMAPLGVKTKESYETNSRGLEIFTKNWLPEALPPKGIVCFCHGYGDTCTFFFEGIARKFAESGYGVFSMDYPGFGLSEGLHGYIPSFEELIDDVIEHFSKVRAQSEFKDLPSFIFGQSMGGAVALKVHLKQPLAWDGTILVAPMCKAVYNVIAYKDKLRLRTAMELLKTTAEIENQLNKVSSPLLILHGDADQVTDPSVSKTLYESSISIDKTLKLYEGGYHCILEGEPDERIFQALDDITSWLDVHCGKREGQ